MRCRRNLAPQPALVPAQIRSMVDETLQIRISVLPTRRNERGDRSLPSVPVHPYEGCFAKQGIQAEGPCRCCRRRQGLLLCARLRDMGEAAYSLHIIPVQMLELAIERAAAAPAFLRVVQRVVGILVNVVTVVGAIGERCTRAQRHLRHAVYRLR